MLILEGSDGVGKTTLANMLLATSFMRDEGYVYSYLTRLPPGWHMFWDHIDFARRRTVQDRFHLSELVYGSLRGGEGTVHPSELTPERYRRVDGHLRGLGAFTVVMTADPELIRMRYETRPEREMYDLELVLSANEIYRRVADVKQYERVVSGRTTVFFDQVDVDARLHFTLDKPKITPEDLTNLMTAYTRRQREWELDAEGRRPSRQR